VVARSPTATARSVPSPTAVVGRPFATFLSLICRAFSSRDAGTVINSLPYYQYNSGLRYGMLGDGEGHTADPSLMRSWLAGSNVRCVAFTPGVAGHGTVLTSGWKVPAIWSLVELDIFNGHWKINDFTFGTRAALYASMQTARPILPYHG
jgi:hypothetical protein